MRNDWICMSQLFILFETKSAGNSSLSDYQLKWLSDYWAKSVYLECTPTANGMNLN